MQLQTFTILLPYGFDGRCRKFEEWSLQYWRGFTEIGVTRGAWLDDSGKRYDDIMRAYKICAPTYAREKILSLAFELFPEELAFYIETDGRGEIVDRPADASIDAGSTAVSLPAGRHDRGWPK